MFIDSDELIRLLQDRCVIMIDEQHRDTYKALVSRSYSEAIELVANLATRPIERPTLVTDDVSKILALFCDDELFKFIKAMEDSTSEGIDVVVVGKMYLKLKRMFAAKEEAQAKLEVK